MEVAVELAATTLQATHQIDLTAMVNLAAQVAAVEGFTEHLATLQNLEQTALAEAVVEEATLQTKTGVLVDLEL
jgi:hypothetical protein